MVPGVCYGDVTEKVEDQVFSAVMAFAHTGDPNCGAPEIVLHNEEELRDFFSKV